MQLTITRGSVAKPLRIILQGQEGVGKTTWAANCPNALFLTCEDGGGVLDYARAVLPSWTDLREAVWSLMRDGGGEFRTIVIDTIDSYERLLWAELCEKANADTIEEIGGGFGKGYTKAAEQMQALSRDLDVLRERHGLNVILLAHVHVRAFNDPNGPAYDRYEMRLHKGTAALWASWADAVLFACFDVTVLKTGKKTRDNRSGVVNADTMEKGKAAKVERVVYTSKDAAFDAKNRHGLPDELPLAWDAFARAIKWDSHRVARRPEIHHAPAGEGHDASFTDEERVWFMAELATLGISYPNLKEYLRVSGKAKPSAITSEDRRKLLGYLGSDTGRAKFGAFMRGEQAAAAK